MTGGAAADAPIARLRASGETRRLTIRHVEERDLDDLLVVHADDDVTRYLPYVTWRSADDAAAWYARIRGREEEGRTRQFVVVDRGDDRVIGSILVFNLEVPNRRAEIGYVLGRRDWGRGVMREALDALMPHLFADLDLNRLEAYVDPRNVASHRLLLSLAFRLEGLLRGRSVMKGAVVDSNVYGLLRSESKAVG